MTKKQANYYGVILLAAGGGLIALKTLETALTKVPSGVFIGCVITGSVLIILGLALLLFPLEATANVCRWLFGKATYEPRQARREDLADIYAFGKKEFGEV